MEISQNRIDFAQDNVSDFVRFEIMACTYLNINFRSLRCMIFRLEASEFLAFQNVLGPPNLEIPLHKYMRTRPYSCTEKVDALEYNPYEQLGVWEKCLRHNKYFPGIIGTTSNTYIPCESRFVNALVSDFVVFSMATTHLVEKICGKRSLDSPLGNLAGIAHQNMSIVMQHCRRLRAHPELFPHEPADLKFTFFLKIRTISSMFHDLSRIANSYDNLLRSVTEPVKDMEQPINAEAEVVKGTIEPEANPDHQNTPEFLPNKLHGKHPWNNWLDNSASPQPGWTAIEQKIPRVGDKICRKIGYLYDAVHREFSENGLILPGSDKTSKDNIPTPGQVFSHMTWSGFCTIPAHDLGFKNGNRKVYDSNGDITVEYLSQCLCKLGGRKGVQQRTSNCPYFRLAVAYENRSNGY